MPTNNPLLRSRKHRILGGVCGGLALFAFDTPVEAYVWPLGVLAAVDRLQPAGLDRLGDPASRRIRLAGTNGNAIDDQTRSADELLQFGLGRVDPVAAHED